ncbi:MAG: hypothetical protein M3R59_02075 [Verrucomicrobiota bacterium]|nr:hypothetical protein [Verrucomicrobiota bacterium]
MVYLLVLLAAVFSFSAVARAELNLTPRLEEYEGDGVKFTHLVFSDGEKHPTYNPPAGWEYSGSAKQLTLRPKSKAQADAIISASKVEKPLAFDEPGIKSYTDEVLATVPGGATDASLVSTQLNPLRMDGRETLLVVIKYKAYGQAFARSVLILNRATEQVRFQFTAREADFKDLQSAFLHSLFTWDGM